MPDELEHIDADEARRRLAEIGLLAGCTLVDADLAELEAHAPVLRDCRLVDVSLRGAALAGLRCSGTHFLRCRFDSADLAGGELTGCAFFDAETEQGCTFARATLRFTTFADCTLDRCVFEEADLANATIRGSRALGASFVKVSFGGGGKMTGCLLRYADLRDANLAQCDLTGNDFEWANLERASLRAATLRDSTLNRAALRRADFRGADLRNANLGGFDPRALDARGAILFEGQARQVLENMELIVLPDNR